MEGGQTFPINLESPLDASSSDMLVPISQPTLQHNWQKHQGKFLVNSVRMEANGWAAGWNVYNIDYNIARLKVPPVWVSAQKLNDNPVYKLNVYDTETSSKAVTSFDLIPESKILSVSGGTAAFGDRITGVLNGKGFVLDYKDRAFAISEGFTVSATERGDRSVLLKITDDSSSYSVDVDLYMPEALAGDGLDNAIDYTKFEDGVHEWADYKFDGSHVTTPDNQRITPDIDGREIRFSYTSRHKETLKISQTLEQYALKFSNARIASQNMKNIITSNASNAAGLTFNGWKGSVSPTLLRPDTDGINVDLIAPVWLSVKGRIVPSDVALPTNVSLSDVIISLPAGRNYTVRATSVFDNVTRTMNVGGGLHSLKSIMAYRFCKIEVSVQGTDGSVRDTLFDFDYDAAQQPQQKAYMRAVWNNWYRGVACPYDMERAATLGSGASITCSLPGIPIGTRTTEQVSYSGTTYKCESSSFPVLQTEFPSVFSGARGGATVFHNALDETDKYEPTGSVPQSRFECKSSSLSSSSYYYLYDAGDVSGLSFFAVTTDSLSSTRINSIDRASNNENGTITKSGKPTFGIRAKDGSCWVSSLTFSGTKASYSLPDGVGAASFTESAGTELEPIFAMCLDGHMMFNIRYSDIYRVYDIPPQAKKALPMEQTGADDGRIFIDREGIRSYSWFDVIIDSVLPQDANGDTMLNIKLAGSQPLYYASEDRNNDMSSVTGKEPVDLYYYPPVLGEGGALYEAASSSLIPAVTMSPDIVSVPEAFTFMLTPENAVSHSFYSNYSKWVSGIGYEIASLLVLLDADTLPVSITVCGKTISAVYNCRSNLLSAQGGIVFDVDNASVTIGAFSSYDKVIDVPMDIVLSFRNITGKIPAASPDTLVKYEDNKFTCIKDGHEYTYDYLRRRLIGSDAYVTVTDEYDHTNVKFDDEVSMSIALLVSNCEGGRFMFSWQGDRLEVDVEELLNQEESIDFVSTDIRTPNRTVKIHSVDPKSEVYQFVRQAWSTTNDVTNFWWVDDNHILELNSAYFVLKRKTDELDDWAGDRFEKIYEIPRTNILTDDVRHYTVTNTYNTDQRGLLLVFRAQNTSTIVCGIYDPRENLRRIGEVYFEILRKEIGQKLIEKTCAGNRAYLNTYGCLTAAQILTHATWTNTIVDGRLIIGCHQSNNYDQWAAVFDLAALTCERCVQGYGFVSLSGDLTGGMLPAEYFDSSMGFTGTVTPVKDLVNKISPDDADAQFLIESVNEINIVEKRIVGTAERQWYIQKELFGIVSHLKYKGNGAFEVCTLPITNKYDAIYKSPSFGSVTYGDLTIQIKGLNEIMVFPSGMAKVWNVISSVLGYPSVYMFNPRHSSIGYLQQTLGQYAYVHYNSSESFEEQPSKSTSARQLMGAAGGGRTSLNQWEEVNAEDPVLNDTITFDKQIAAQKLITDNSEKSRFVEVLMGVTQNEQAHFDRDFRVNKELNQTAVSDTGKKYVQNALENLGGLLVESLVTNSNFEIGLTSKVVGLRSLDMFYSTSDKQRIFAGPGFVEHQFVADCVAQSVTDVNCAGNVIQTSFVISSLTYMQDRLTLYLTELLADFLDESANSTKENTSCTQNWGAGIAAGMNTAAYILRLVNATQKVALDCIENIVDELAKANIHSNNVGEVIRSTMVPEGKHKYGEKNETFMWPCWGTPTEGLTYKDETVNASIIQSEWICNLPASIYSADNLNVGISYATKVKFSDIGKATLEKKARNNVYYQHSGGIPFYQASCYGTITDRKLPEDMACIQGVESFLPGQSFKNENIGVSEPAFTPSMFQDFIVDRDWNISQCATYGLGQWITCKDTKLTNCPPSNMRINAGFCGVATPYTAIEVKRGISKEYMRPVTITPDTLLLNCSGYNCLRDNTAYHACDGLSYRVVEWTGTPGLNKNKQTFLYGFQVNDRFKRSNKFPANEVQGNFASEPTQAIETIDKFWTDVTVAQDGRGLEAGTVGEDKDLTRWAIPIFTEPVTTLPAAVKTMAAMPLVVVAGVTGLVTNLYSNQTAYKAPRSVDFTIGKSVYRQTEAYICSLRTERGVDVVEPLVPSLGLVFIGSTPTEAYFYSEATRYYYTFTGSNLMKMDMLERFRNITGGFWDFVNQEVVMPCLMTFKRLNPEVLDKDTETDNIIVPMMSKNQLSGELPPPITTIFNDRSWYKCYSLPSGFAYQGPNRVIINRSVFVEYMLDSMKDNLGKWKRMDKERYVTKREYPEAYTDITTDVGGVYGWTHNPFLLVTSALGQGESTDCLFEWEITFCWPIEMDLLYGVDNYAVVNIMAETMTQGGRLKSRPTHVPLTKELFTRTGSYGYYTFRFQSKNGAGNRERLHIWSDQYIAISSLSCEVKTITSRRAEQLVQQVDVQHLKEL